jgi:YD repeat-containing protein
LGPSNIYAYDRAANMQSFTFEMATQTSYTYDANGNLLSQVITASGVQRMTCTWDQVKVMDYPGMRFSRR